MIRDSWFSAFIGNTKNGTELLIKVCNTDGRKTHVFHVVLVRVQTFGGGFAGAHRIFPCQEVQ